MKRGYTSETFQAVQPELVSAKDKNSLDSELGSQHSK